jgi:hypothetical protein
MASMSFEFIDQKFGRSPVVTSQKPKRDWFCDNCNDVVEARDVTFQETHATCGCPVEPSCSDCENGGWVQVYSQNPPMFGKCQSCFNPFDRPSP